MRRSHRTVHRRLWPVLAFAVGLGVALALALRPLPAADATVVEMPIETGS